jgi:hypothetical protein
MTSLNAPLPSASGSHFWCSLSLTEGLTTMEPAAAPSLVSGEMRLFLPADPSALRVARIRGRMMLTVLGGAVISMPRSTCCTSW